MSSPRDRDIESSDSHIERPHYELTWSTHGDVMVLEQQKLPEPLDPRTRQHVSSAVAAALVAAATAVVLLLLGFRWGGYLLVIPILVFGMIFVWSQRRAYLATKGQRTIGVSRDVVRIHALESDTGVHHVAPTTVVSAEDDCVIIATGAEEMTLFRQLAPEDASRISAEIGRFLSESGEE